MRLGINIMPPKNINDFFSPVSTGTNPHQQIDDLILMEELDKIAKENMMYGAMTQFQPDVHAPTVTPFALDAELAPLKAMGWLLGKGKGIKDVLSHTSKTIGDLLGGGFVPGKKGKWIDVDTSSRLARDVAEDLPDVRYIEGKAGKLRELETLSDEAAFTAESPEELNRVMEKYLGILRTENLSPGAGLTEDYFVKYPTKEGIGAIGFKPLRVTETWDEVIKGGTRASAVGQKTDEIGMMIRIDSNIESLTKEMFDVLQRGGKDLSSPDLSEYLKKNWEKFDELLESITIKDELSKRMEIRDELLKKHVDIAEGKPY